MIGSVKWFNPVKGFGFIQPESGNKDVFVHIKDVFVHIKDVFVHISAVERSELKTLSEGQRVSYDLIDEKGRQSAGNLKNA